jgi:HEAT repeat protein
MSPRSPLRLRRLTLAVLACLIGSAALLAADVDIDRELSVLRGKNANAVARQEALRRLASATVVENKRKEVIEAVLTALEGTDPPTARLAGTALARWITAETADVPRLVKLLESKNDGARHGAIAVLARLKDPRAIEGIASRVPYDRYDAGRALIRIGPDAEKAVWPLLQNRSGEAIREACRVLKRIGSPASIPQLEPLLKYRDASIALLSKVTIRAIEARQANGGKDPVDEQFKNTRADPDVKPKNERLAAAIASARKSPGAVTSGIVNGLGICEPEAEFRAEVVERLLLAMESNSAPLVELAAKHLPKWVSSDSVSIYRLFDVLDQENGYARRGALLALARLKDPRTAVAVAERLPIDTFEATEALVAIGPAGEKALYPILGFHVHGDFSASKAACRVLRRIGTPASLKELEAILTSKDPMVGVYSRIAMRSIKERVANGGKDPVDEKVIPVTQEERDRKPTNARLAENLTQVRARLMPDCGFALKDLAKMKPEEEFRGAVTELLMQCMDEADGIIASNATAALPNWIAPNRVSIYWLIDDLDSMNPSVRGAAMECLGKLKDPRAAEAVADWLGTFPREAGAAVKSIGPACEKYVWPHLKHTNFQIVIGSCQVLKEVGGPASLKELEPLLKHQSAGVRGEAQAAIDAIRKRGG